MLTLLTAQLGGIHRLAQNLDSHGTGLFQGAILLVILLQQALGAGIVCSGAGGLPAAVVARGVAEVQLELAARVPAGIDEGDAKGAKTAVLRVSLLQVAQSSNELLAGNVFVVGEKVSLGGLSGVVDENVGIGRHAGNGADHVTVKGLAGVWPGVFILCFIFRCDILIQDV